jgi:glycosyltransferase involved in cell wall biosynthesis
MIKILHIAAHLGDGAGKAITGLSASDNKNRYFIYLLDEPQKMKWVDYARRHGIEVFWGDKALFDEKVVSADVTVFNWWECKANLVFLPKWCKMQGRKIVWAHQNGVYPPFPEGLVASCDKFLVTTPLTIDKYPQIGTVEENLVYGFGNFRIADFVPKTDYSIGTVFGIVYVGHCSYKRFPDNILDYFRAIITKIPNVNITMFGEISDDFRDDVQSSEIAEQIDLQGWVADVVSRMRNFDAGIYLVKDEIYSTTENSVVEYMASGAPSVISRNLPYKYLLEDGVSGFHAGTPGEFADCVYALYKDEHLRRKIGQGARKFCKKQYNAKKNLNKFVSACSEICKSELPPK